MKKTIKVNALLNTIKQIMQIIFPVITIPYIARVLLSENYGRINTGNSIISYISLIAGLGISSYAVREGSLVRDNRKEFDNFSSQVFSINLFSTFVAYLVLGFLIICVPHYHEYRYLLLIQGIVVLFNTLGADWINSIEEDYIYLTLRYVVLHIIALVLMFLFVKKPEDYYIYAAICLVTSAGANLLNIFYIRRYVSLRITFHIDWKRHFIPILILFGNAVAISIYVNSDITMLEIFKGAAEVGIYSVSAKIYGIVKQVLNAVLVVSIPRLTMFMGQNKLDDFFKLGKKMISALITMMCPLIIGIIVFRTEAVFFVGGEEYISGTDSLLILSFAIAASLLATFYSACVLMPLHREKDIFVGTIISAVINVVLNLFFIQYWGSIGAAITTLISELIVAFYFWHLVRQRKFYFLDHRALLLSLIGSIAVGLFSFVLKRSIDSFAICFPLAVLGSAIIYGLIQLLGKNTVVVELISGIVDKFKTKGCV